MAAISRRHLVLLSLLVAVDGYFITPDAALDAAEANHGRSVCERRFHSRNARDIYPNPDDCHSYIRCYFENLEHPIGVKHHCPPRYFWSDDVLQCLPEGDTPCIDQCRNGTMAEKGCYGVDRNCAKLYRCVGSVSQLTCCPDGTQADENTCTCTKDPNNFCLARCTVPHLNDKASDKANRDRYVLEVSSHNQTSCKDLFGNIIQASEDYPEQFVFVEMAESMKAIPNAHIDPIPGVCPSEQYFDIRSCLCREPEYHNDDDSTEELRSPAMGGWKISEEEDRPRSRQCSMYLPFDKDYSDHSLGKINTYAYSNIEISEEAARGNGSLFLNHGRFEMPFSRQVDLRDQASWCLFFRCQNADGSHSCVKSGGLLSDHFRTDIIDFSISLKAMANNEIEAMLSFEHPDNIATVKGLASDSGFNQVCLTYDSKYVTFFINNVIFLRVPQIFHMF